MQKYLITFLLIMYSVYMFSSFAETDKKSKKITIEEKAGDMVFSYQPDPGAKLTVFGIPFIKESSLWIMKPKWTQRIYSFPDNPKMMEEAKIEDFEDGKKITFFHKLSKNNDVNLNGKEIYILKPDNTFTAHLEFTMSISSPAIFEWKIAGINAAPIFGRKYTFNDGKEIKENSIPLIAEFSEINDTIIKKGFNTIVIDSLFGPIEIISKAEDNVALLDFRKNKWASPDNPMLWLGILDRDIKSGEKFSYTITFKFPAKLESKISKNVEQYEIKTSLAENTLMPNWGQDYIIPKPKSLKYTNETLPITDNLKIFTGKNTSPEFDNAINYFLDEIKNMYNVDAHVIKEEYPTDKNIEDTIIISENGRYNDINKILERAKISIPENPQGYALFINNKMGCISSKTTEGIFYGITTLLQLAAIDGNGIFFKGAEIIDYPSLEFRGIHCLSAKNGGDEISKALKTLISRFKMNYLVWECEYIIWDSYPELAHKDYGMTKTEAKKVIDTAKKCFIEIIPLVQSLGHSEWIFTNDKNLDLAEDPEKPYAYNPTNPDTYKFIFKVYQEAIDFFKPKMFHIGHDEITTDASRFPYRSKNSGKTVTELILGDIIKLHNWFKERDIRIMLWGDMFLWNEEANGAAFASSLEEAKLRRKMLPKDSIIADWHYDAGKPEEFKSLKVFKDEGYQTVGAGWYLPDNISNFNKACIDNNVWGYLQTTWAGFNFKITDNKDAWFQYWAYIWAAYYSWSGDTTPPDKLPFSAREKFLDLWFEKKPVLKPSAGYLFDLSSVYNRKLADSKNRDGWLGYGSELDLSSLPNYENSFNGVKFLIKKNNKDENCIFLAGTQNPKGSYPKSVEISFEKIKTPELHFLITSNMKTNDENKIGEIIITYSDGVEHSKFLKYGDNIFAYDDGRLSKSTDIAWKAKSNIGTDLFVFDYTFKNPCSDKEINKITIKSDAKESSPIILAITAVK